MARVYSNDIRPMIREVSLIVSQIINVDWSYIVRYRWNINNYGHFIINSVNLCVWSHAFVCFKRSSNSGKIVIIFESDLGGTKMFIQLKLLIISVTSHWLSSLTTLVEWILLAKTGQIYSDLYRILTIFSRLLYFFGPVSNIILLIIHAKMYNIQRSNTAYYNKFEISFITIIYIHIQLLVFILSASVIPDDFICYKRLRRRRYFLFRLFT